MPELGRLVPMDDWEDFVGIVVDQPRYEDRSNRQESPEVTLERRQTQPRRNLR